MSHLTICTCAAPFAVTCEFCMSKEDINSPNFVATKTTAKMVLLETYKGWTIERNPHGLIVASKLDFAFPFIAPTIERAKATIDSRESIFRVICSNVLTR